MRIFLAVAIPDALKVALSHFTSSLATRPGVVKWTATEQLHITLLFVGETDSALLPAMSDALHVPTETASAFTLVPSQLGAFPSSARPQVVWIGLERGRGYDVMEQLHAAVRGALSSWMPAARPQPFTPHITLGRVRRSASPDDRRELGSALQRQQSTPADVRRPFSVDSITLMESRLGPGGPTYLSLAEFPLSNPRVRP